MFEYERVVWLHLRRVARRQRLEQASKLLRRVLLFMFAKKQART